MTPNHLQSPLMEFLFSLKLHPYKCLTPPHFTPIGIICKHSTNTLICCFFRRFSSCLFLGGSLSRWVFLSLARVQILLPITADYRFPTTTTWPSLHHHFTTIFYHLPLCSKSSSSIQHLLFFSFFHFFKVFFFIIWILLHFIYLFTFTLLM